MSETPQPARPFSDRELADIWASWQHRPNHFVARLVATIDALTAERDEYQRLWHEHESAAIEQQSYRCLAEEQLAEVRAALQAAEWEGNPSDAWSNCPVCHNYRKDDHDPRCKLAAALDAIARSAEAPASEGQEGASDG